MKKLIKSRRGVAIELAIGVMFLMIAFTIMLLSTSALQNDHRVDDYQSFKEKIEVDNIGEYVVEKASYKAILNSKQDIKYEDAETSQEIDTGYDVICSSLGGNEYKYEIYRGDGDSAELVLTIELNADSTIKSWK